MTNAQNVFSRRHWPCLLFIVLGLLTGFSLHAQDDAKEPAAELEGPQTVSKLRLIIDGYEWIWDEAAAAPYPSPRNEEGKSPGRLKPQTVCRLIGVAPGQTFPYGELEALGLRREKEITATQLFFNIQITVLPGQSNPSRVTLFVEIKSGFSLRPFFGPIFAGLGDMSFDGNLTIVSGSLGANHASFTFGQGNSNAGPFWWQTQADYANSLLETGPLWHELGLSAYAGSAWLPLSPWVGLRAWKEIGPGSVLPAEWGMRASVNIMKNDSAEYGSWILSCGAMASCIFLSYSPEWILCIQPDVRANFKARYGSLTMAVQGSLAGQTVSTIQKYSLCLAGDPTRAVRGGYATVDEAFADRAAFFNAELRLADLLVVPVWFTRIDIQPYVYFDFAAAGHLADASLFDRELWAAGGGIRLQFDVPVFICLDLCYGWSDQGLPAFSFSISPGF
jgi:hypothetical protein